MNIYAIESAMEHDILTTAMQEDDHNIPSPTHIVESGNHIIGAFSIAYAPVLFFWMSETRADRLTSYKAFKTAMELIKAKGFDNVILPIHPDSPFYSFINKLGFEFVGAGEIYMRG